MRLINMIVIIMIMITLTGCSDTMYNNPDKLITCKQLEPEDDCMKCCVGIRARVWSSEQRWDNCKQECTDEVFE